MIKRIKQYFLWAVAGGVLYFLLSYHIIYSEKSLYLLEKSEKTLEYTFYSLDEKKPEHILRVDDLRYDGIGELLVELGMITEEDMWKLIDHFDNETPD
ncbi:MAG: hypothetical protein PVI90_15035 [Desulfobacteraceae bacterium]|jgi:hypothetical protein